VVRVEASRDRANQTPQTFRITMNSALNAITAKYKAKIQSKMKQIEILSLAIVGLRSAVISESPFLMPCQRAPNRSQNSRAVHPWRGDLNVGFPVISKLEIAARVYYDAFAPAPELFELICTMAITDKMLKRCFCWCDTQNHQISVGKTFFQDCPMLPINLASPKPTAKRRLFPSYQRTTSAQLAPSESIRQLQRTTDNSAITSALEFFWALPSGRIGGNPDYEPIVKSWSVDTRSQYLAIWDDATGINVQSADRTLLLGELL